MKNRVLLVDDEKEILTLLTYIFEKQGYSVQSVQRGDDAVKVATSWSPDIVILDIGLPGLNGLEVCTHLVAMDIPVIFLSSHDQDDQIIEGLEVGGEDYVSKPFNYKELLLRVEKVLKRVQVHEEKILVVGDLTINLEQQTLYCKDVLLNLTPTEFKILEVLATYLHTPVSVQKILQTVWKNEDWIQGSELVKVNMSRLRKKVEEDPASPRYIINKWGVGYILTDAKGT
ncbi:MAG: response regulator transcription factor [Sphaerochaeta sp.]|nr:response regulator transcription factor [Sphaerochaeta sp.]